MEGKKLPAPSPEAESYVTVVFKDPDSSIFRYDRKGCSAWQLMMVAKTFETLQRRMPSARRSSCLVHTRHLMFSDHAL